MQLHMCRHVYDKNVDRALTSRRAAQLYCTAFTAHSVYVRVVPCLQHADPRALSLCSLLLLQWTCPTELYGIGKYAAGKGLHTGCFEATALLSIEFNLSWRGSWGRSAASI